MEEKQTDIIGWCYCCSQPICNNERYVSSEARGVKVYFCKECADNLTMTRGGNA